MSCQQYRASARLFAAWPKIQHGHSAGIALLCGTLGFVYSRLCLHQPLPMPLSTSSRHVIHYESELVKRLVNLFKKRPDSPTSDNQQHPRSPARPSSARPAPTSPQRPSNTGPAPEAEGAAGDFASLGLIEPLLRAVSQQGYTQPTPIQSQAIPQVLAGRDVLGCAQTGTGKTAAFALPILQRLAQPQGGRRPIRALVLTPTRELALQIDENFRAYGKLLHLRYAIIFGGVGFEQQRRALAAHPDILVATPGRLLDLMSQGLIDLRDLQIFVLDEADRMLDMGFINDVKKVIAALPAVRQNLLFSATMPREIADLAMRILKNPTKVEVARVSSTSELIDQKLYYVDRGNKRHLLLHVLEDSAVTRAIVFARTKANANRVSEFLCKSGINAEAIHGNKSQNARQRALANFKSGSTRVLVASDLAARGIDIDLVSHVINYDVPNVPETYVHRIGRTGRAQQTGIGLSFCDHEERAYIRGIEALIKQKIPVVEDHPFPMSANAPQSPAAPSGRGGQGRGSHAGRSSNAPRQGSARPASREGGDAESATTTNKPRRHRGKGRGRPR